MLTIAERRKGDYGEMWLTQIDREAWKWLSVELPYFVLHDDLKILPTSTIQSASDLDLITLPQYACKVPAVTFFPYITYLVRDWFRLPFGPTFIILSSPLDRLKGRNWISSLAARPTELLTHNPDGMQHGWIKPDGTAYRDGGWPIDYLDLKRLSNAVETLFLEDIRYVYDETKRSSDSTKTTAPTRYQFSADTVSFLATQTYLNWYIQQLNSFLSKLIAIGKVATSVQREKCLVAGWTVNRLAVDILTIFEIDVPYVRKWQFFAFLDAVAALINELDGTGHKNSKDSDTAKRLLDQQFLNDNLLPILAQIPVGPIRDELISHTRAQYDAIAQMASGSSHGPDVVWLYRNTRHGYTLKESKKRTLLLQHSGAIPDDLPDLAIALWHYVLLRFPFT